MNGDFRDEVYFAEHFIHQITKPVNVFITNLHKDGAGIRQQIPRDGEPVPQVGEIAVDAVAPGVAEGFDLLRLAGDVADIAVLHVAAGGGPLEVAVELDAVGRIEVDALHLAAQALALATLLEQKFGSGELDVLTPEALQALMGVLCKIYGANQEEGNKFPILSGRAAVTGTDVMIACGGLLKAVDLQVFELGMWQSWSGT